MSAALTAADAEAVRMLEGPEADFSLVLGGPLFQLWRRARMADDGLKLLRRRVAAAVLLAWFPLLVLSLLERHAWSGVVSLPFLWDVELHVRLLFALPLLIVAELVVHQRLRSIVSAFLEDGLVPDAARPQFDAALASALRLRNSVLAESLLLVLVYGVGVLFVWRTQVALDLPSWYGVAVNGQLQPTLAGWWLGCVSLPVFQFLLVRWYWRLFIWARFLWQVSRIRLHLVVAHPDRCGGLGFLGAVRVAFAPLLVAQGALVAGMIANRIFFAGAELTHFQLELAGAVTLMLALVLGPLLVFSPQLDAASRAGVREYGTLATRYARAFDRKWLRGDAPPDEQLIGSADIQSLADMGNSFAVVESMRWMPFSFQTVVRLAIVTLLPVLPLTLTMFSANELLERLLAIVF
jgi:hypothetical protein